MVVERQTGLAQPGRAARLGDPENLVGGDYRAGARAQLPGGDLGDFGVKVHRDLPFGQNLGESRAHGGVVSGQDARAGGKQMQPQFVGLTAPRRQFLAQAIMQGQGQFDPAGPRADHGESGGSGVAANPLEQGQPAFVEAADRLHRHGVLVRAGDVAQLRGGTDVDG